MKKTAVHILLSLLIITLLPSCDEIIEKDLEEKEITIIAPADGLVTSNTSMTFWWDVVKGATGYNIQLVSPAFDHVEKLWADSVVTENKFQLSLVPGSYQWRVRAQNGSSESYYFTASFAIDSTLNITEETVILTSPGNNAVSNKTLQSFKWNMLYNANEYRFQVTDKSETLLADVTTEDTESSFEFQADGEYAWSVRAQNDISITQYSTFKIQIDTQKPGIPSLKTPGNSTSITTDSINFTWTRADDSGSKLHDSLYVFEDINMTYKVLSKKTENTFYADSLKAGTYYWYVKSIDAAGNIGERSSLFNFTKN